jgi:flagellar biosynthesis component FlhA
VRPKFVSGDAIAGLLILLINLVGGLTIGVIQHNLSVSDAGKIYTLLTIGDGLVAQIPSLLLSLATAIIVTRVTTSESISEQARHPVSQSCGIVYFFHHFGGFGFGTRHASFDVHHIGRSHRRIRSVGDSKRG